MPKRRSDDDSDPSSSSKMMAPEGRRIVRALQSPVRPPGAARPAPAESHQIRDSVRNQSRVAADTKNYIDSLDMSVQNSTEFTATLWRVRRWMVQQQFHIRQQLEVNNAPTMPVRSPAPQVIPPAQLVTHQPQVAASPVAPATTQPPLLGSIHFPTQPPAMFASSTATTQPPSMFASSAATTAPNSAPYGAGDEGDDDTIGAEDNPNDKVQAAIDPDWDTISSVDQVRFYRMKDNKDKDSTWTTHGPKGNLCLQRGVRPGTTVGKKRILMRGETFNVITINMIIDSGITFQMTKEHKKGEDFGIISFFGVNNEDRGYEQCKIRAKLANAEKLLKGLQSLAAYST